MNFFKILKYSLLIGISAFILMLINFYVFLNFYFLFDYLEFWAVILLLMISIYFFTKENFKANPLIGQNRLFYPDLFISLLSGLIYGILSCLYISVFNKNYYDIISSAALANLPAKEDTEGILMGLAFMYTAYFQLFFKFIGTSLFGLVYSIFIVNHFLWIQEICIKYKLGDLPTIEKHHPDV